jgi:hypothetical protein
LFKEHAWGKLVPGYAADIVVLDTDLFALPQDSLTAPRVRYTIIGGKVVYRRD